MQTLAEWALRALLVLAAAAAAGGPVAAQTNDERSLEEVREKIGALERRLIRQNAERDSAAEALKTAELEIAAARSDLERLEERSREQQRRGEALAARSDAARKSLEAEREALARQARLTYMNGREEVLKLLLSQETPADFGRMMVYYDYFNRARSDRVGAVAGELAELRELEAEAVQVRTELEELAAAEAERVAALDRSREERRKLVAELAGRIAADGSEIERLKDEEQRLAKLITELGEALAAFPVESEEPFPRLKGRLAWPVRGEIAGDYGEPRRGGPVRWNGVLLTSPQGTPVRAVYHGRVAYADWLPGLGLLMVVDHGDGYMTLYGHNDALLKEAGDWVAPGEPIAHVGDTGGQARPSLYFEIRHNGKPVDPHQWISN